MRVQFYSLSWSKTHMICYPIQLRFVVSQCYLASIWRQPSFEISRDSDALFIFVPVFICRSFDAGHFPNRGETFHPLLALGWVCLLSPQWLWPCVLDFCYERISILIQQFHGQQLFANSLAVQKIAELEA